MKANYEKPMILFESFELNQSIATNCGESAIGQTNHYTKSTCGFIWGSGTIWTADNTGCDVAAGEDDDVLGYCYNTPTPGMQIFSS